MFSIVVLVSAIQFDLQFTPKNDLSYKVITDKVFTVDIPYDCHQITIPAKKCGLDCCRVKIDKGIEFIVKQPSLDLLQSEISQDQRQVTVFRGIVPTMSIDVESVDVVVSTKQRILKANPKPVSLKNNKVQFKLSPNQDFIVQFQNTNYGPIIELYTRKVYIEQYSGVINVFNKYLLVNHGSKLDYFNRADYMRRRQIIENLPVVQDLTFTLPGGATEPWVRDDVGNISTSNFRAGRPPKLDTSKGGLKTFKQRYATLDIKPRYPIFGGWKFDFGNGYFLDAKHHMVTGPYDEMYALLKKSVEIEKTNTQSPHYFYVALHLADVPKSFTVHHFKVEIVLPEGAHHIHVQGNFHTIQLDKNKEFSYFDALGRVKVVLTLDYLQQDQPIKIVYALSPFDYKFRKLATISLGLFGLFTSLLGLSRVHLSLK